MQQIPQVFSNFTRTFIPISDTPMSQPSPAIPRLSATVPLFQMSPPPTTWQTLSVPQDSAEGASPLHDLSPPPRQGLPFPGVLGPSDSLARCMSPCFYLLPTGLMLLEGKARLWSKVQKVPTYPQTTDPSITPALTTPCAPCPVKICGMICISESVKVLTIVLDTK